MEKEYEILKYLNSSPLPINISKLQNLFNVSRRSIINYVNMINEISPNLISSSNKGYSVSNHETANKLIRENNQTFSSYESRKIYILENILKNNYRLSINELAYKLCVTESTIIKDILRLKKSLININIDIKTKNGVLYIIGEEKDKQKLITKIINKELETNHFSIDSIQKYFSYANISKIKNVVTITLSEFEYNIDNYSLFNYIIHLAVCIETNYIYDCVSACSYSFGNEYANECSNHIVKIVEKIYTILKETFPESSFSKNDIIEASILMSTRAFSTKLNEFDLNQIQKYVGEETKELLSEILKAIEKNYGVSLYNNDFIARFAFHLKNLLTRLREGVELPNVSMSSFKDDYPFVYLIANNISKIISAWIEKPIPENEIFYITLHLGILFEERKDDNKKINCVVVSNDYLNLGKTIFSRISMNVDNLFLLDVVPSYDEISYDNVDLVLTVLDTSTEVNIPQVHISLYPSIFEIEAIKKYAKNIKKTRHIDKIKKKINKLFTNELFFSNINISSSDNIINFLCKELYQKGYVEESFVNDIFAHEAVVPSEYLNIAIPHPLTSNSDNINNSAVAVLISKEPITWNKNKVNFIFLICLKKDDKALFSEIFKLVTSALTNEKTLNLLYECHNCEQFINILLSNIN